MLCATTAFSAIPEPPWGSETPTNSAAVVSYVQSVLTSLPPATVREIQQVQARKGSSAELLSILYAARLDESTRACLAPHSASGKGPAAPPSDMADIIRQLDAFWSLSDTNASSRRSLAATVEKIRLADEISALVSGTNETFTDLSRFVPALDLPAPPWQLFSKASGLMHRDDYTRAAPMLELLASTNNHNQFVLGGAHFWLGHIAYAHHHDLSNALAHLVVPHRSPGACLVLVDESYIEAAQICDAMGKADTAAALYSIMVPNHEAWANEVRKALATFALAQRQNDPTNAARQILRLDGSANYGIGGVQQIATSMRCDFARKWTNACLDKLAAWLAANDSRRQHEAAAIRKALEGPDRTKDNPLLADMLLHEWPSMEYVQKHYATVLTNRALSNNIFEQRRRILK